MAGKDSKNENVSAIASLKIGENGKLELVTYAKIDIRPLIFKWTPQAILP